MNRSSMALMLAVLGVVSISKGAVDPFQENIRPTDALTPQEEEKAFHLPPGFEIHLVTSEPEIGKPMNIAFDDKGRLWVTCTTEYPFPSLPVDKPGKDMIKIISFNPDGSTKSIETFASGLNIPVGVYPYKDGCFAYSIPMISRYQDTDGDGKADKVTPLIGPFDFSQDTHGMTSNFVRGFDGWIYGCHGWANTSTVHGLDGQSITMPQGNTYRYKTDGSHIEYFTHGQTNPFGLCLDPIGNLYSADSHSKPIYSLLRGGWYESLIPREDGLGYAPHMMTHLHGSTAIASVMYYGAEQWPAEYRGNMFVGNVVTSRINRDSITYTGSSPTAHEEKDFVTTDDPWFRPNQIKVGPDGAVYVSDFYNKIIGHYEVPLNNPLRDYTKGRIWRITYTGKEAHAERGNLPDFTKESVQELIAALNHPNLAVRMLATDELSDRVGQAAIEPLKAIFKGTPTAFEGRHALWVLYRLGAIEKGSELLNNAAKLPDGGTRVQVMRILAEMPEWDEAEDQIVMDGLKDEDAMVRRSAADALGQHPKATNIRPLLDLLGTTEKEDTHLIYVARMSLRNQLGAEGAFKMVDDSNLNEKQTKAVADVCMSVKTPESASWLARHVDALADRGDTGRVLRHIAQYIDPADFDALAQVVKQKFGGDVDFQMELLGSIREGLTQRGVAPTPALRAWALDLATKALRPTKEVSVSDWTNVPMKDLATGNPWTYEQRHCDDSQDRLLLSSLPHGEGLTGTLRSKEFTIPAKFSFYLAGHMGHPPAKANHKNKIQLVDAETKEVLMTSYPPRDDVGHHMMWDLSKFAGKKGYLEVIDNDRGNAYAWLAFGRLDPAVVEMPPGSPSDSQMRVQQACEVAGVFKLTELSADLEKVLAAGDTASDTRAAAATALGQCGSEDGVPALAALVTDEHQPEELRQQVVMALGPMSGKSEAAREALVKAFHGAPNAMQMLLATQLSGSVEGSKALLDGVEKGLAPGAVLFDTKIADRLAGNVPDAPARIKQLTRGMAPPSQAIQVTIDQRAGQYRFFRPNAERGAAIFAKTCAVCHSIDGHGAVVGPNLDGIGNRGMGRVIEDILDPNRNVDPAFRYSTVYLKDGTVVTGLQRRDNGDTLTFVDSTAKEITVPKSQIKKRSESKSSLMPSNFAEAIPTTDFYDLLSFLLQHKTSK